MARQNGPHFITGTIQSLNFYQLNGRYYVRVKSSLDKERFQKDKAFATSRQKSQQFARAARLASLFYQQIPKEKRKQGLIATLTGQVNRLLQQGHTLERILQTLQQPCSITTKKTSPSFSKPASRKPVLSPWQIASTGKLHYGSVTQQKASPSCQPPGRMLSALATIYTFSDS